MPNLALNVDNIPVLNTDLSFELNFPTFMANSEYGPLSLAERCLVFIQPTIVYYYYANFSSAL